MHVWIVIAAAAVVAVLHSILPDHWVPISVVARANRWTLGRTAKTSLWAAGGHVLGSLLLGAVLIALGTGAKAVIAVQGQVVGIVLIVTGVGLLAWAVWQRRSGHGHHHGHGHPHPHAMAGVHAHEAAHAHTHPHAHDHTHPHDHGHTHEHDHPHDHDHSHSDDHSGDHDHANGPAGAPAAGKGWAASLAIPFGVAASPDLTILPVFLAASAISLAASITVVVVFSFTTLATFVGLTVAATAGGYRVEWPWLERNAEIVSAAVLVALGIAAYLAF